MNKKNKLKAIVAIAVALAFLAPGSAVFASDEATFADTIVSIDPLTQTAEKGNSFTVDVFVEPGEAIAGVQLGLYFDQTTIQADLVTEGDLFSGSTTLFEPGIIDNVAGTITGTYGVVIMGSLPTDPGVFCIISFTALDSGISPLDLDAVKVIDGSGDPVPIVVNDGSVTVEEYAYLTISVDGEGDTVPAPGVHQFTLGTDVPLTATADPGWTFSEWTGGVAEPYSAITNIIMNEDKIVTAYFTQDQYALDITIVGSGTVTKAPDQTTYTYDTVVTLTPEPVIGWSFDDWTGPDASEIVGDKITMIKDMEVTATFTEDQYTLDITIVGAGCSVGVNPAGPYIHGIVVTLTPVPDVGWVFGAWSGPDVGEIVGDKITMTKDMEVTATFLNEWTVKMTIAGDIDAPSFVLMKDYVYFGEKVTASDGKDSNDLPYPGTPPEPYVAAWFVTDFEWPYDLLEKDIRHYQTPTGTAQIWDLWVKADTAGTADTVDITMTWDSTLLSGCEFDYVGLYDVLSGNLLKDMKVANGYTFTLDDGMAYHFQIIAGWTVEFGVECGWNLIAMPAYEENFDKTNLIVEHNGYYRTWDEAIALGWILGFTYGWEAGAYSNDNYLTRGDGYWMWAYTDCRIVVPSVAAPEDHITTFDDGEGWYLVGAPYTADLTKNQVRIQYEANYYTWWQADDFIILTHLYDWERANQNYELSDGFDSGFGYWMYVYEPCSLKRL